MNRPNTRPTPHARSFHRNGRAIIRIAGLFARLDLPDDWDPPEGRPIMFAGNHRSFFDILVAYAVFAKLEVTSHILVRADLFEKPVVGWWLRRTGCIPMNKHTREEAERTAIAALQAGHTVSIMPEGRLVPAHERPYGVSPGRPGVSRIVRATDAVLIPVAFHGTDLVWPRGVPFPIPRFRRPTVTLWLGEPVEFHHDDHAENADALMEEIRLLLEQIDVELAAEDYVSGRRGSGGSRRSDR